ncbi:hypothetical protein K435DRAFT_942804 [Dendrothele bispora CBS 962.96]|uniref:Uncharacterized protein n=1 Tax=Dendrothele bispora (strain CBS 962.96) TaxID=1314807 RepID=A0A4S8M8G8_DENBC|nr:hypothetical protein K435DRAFT_942804 [Dendrothele bispora CBS 962.96]
MSSPWGSVHGKEGIRAEHGWTRFHYDVANWGKTFSCFVNLPRTLEKELASAWLCQAMFVASANTGDTSNPKQYGVTTEVRISLMPDVETALLHPNIIPKTIFMFITPFQAIQQVQKFFGYEPSTQDFAEACGLPLIEVVPYSEDPGKPHADQYIEELDNWHIIHGDLDEVPSSDSESMHDGTSAQSQEIWFPIPRVRQEMNLTVAEILGYQDLDVSELDSCSEDWNDFGSETSKFDSPSDLPIQYLEPSPWLEGYLIGNDDLRKFCRSVTSRDGTRFCWMFELDAPNAGPPVYTECWICVDCHHSHVQAQPVICAKCHMQFGNNGPWDIMALKPLNSCNFYIKNENLRKIRIARVSSSLLSKAESLDPYFRNSGGSATRIVHVRDYGFMLTVETPQVSVLMLTNFLNTIFLAMYLYKTLVVNFGVIDSLITADWLLATDPIMNGLIALYVQVFFVWRIKALTGSTLTAGAILIPTIAGFVGSGLS